MTPPMPIRPIRKPETRPIEQAKARKGMEAESIGCDEGLTGSQGGGGLRSERGGTEGKYSDVRKVQEKLS